MDKLHDFLLQWGINHAKNKDLISKKIITIENGKNGYDCCIKYKDKEHYLIIAPEFDFENIVKKLTNVAHFSIITINSRPNLELLIKNWNRLVEYRFLSIIFVNPFSANEKRWIIAPHVHDRICDPASLKGGLRSIFETVDPIDIGDFRARLKD